jgi:hypothetical protein
LLGALGALLYNKNEKRNTRRYNNRHALYDQSFWGLSLIALSIFSKENNNGEQCGVKRLGTVDDYFRMWSRPSRKSVALYTNTFRKSLSLNSADNDQNTLDSYSKGSFVHFVCFFIFEVEFLAFVKTKQGPTMSPKKQEH